MESLGLAKVRKTPPQAGAGRVKPVADDKTLEAIIANRYEVMAKYAKNCAAPWLPSWTRVKAPKGPQNTAHWKADMQAKAWLHRDDDKIPQPA